MYAKLQYQWSSRVGLFATSFEAMPGAVFPVQPTRVASRRTVNHARGPTRFRWNIYETPSLKSEVSKDDLIALFESTSLVDKPNDNSATELIWDPPAELAVTLLPHQEEGVQWMIEREQSEAKGGILADDMGLGKTVQAIALMLATRNSVPKGKPKTTLVVAPLALLEQWRMEVEEKANGGDLGGMADLFRGLRFDDKERDPVPAPRHKRVETEISSTEQERVVQVDFGPVPQFSRGGGRRRDWESTKVARAMHILRSPHRDDPALKTPKTIVFSQFTSMLDIMERALNYDGMLFERFDGKMTRPQKENALARFKHDPDVPVLLMSLKSGALGLNLTAASRIILLDLWWNPQIESQAFDRVHRLGQEHAVIVHKLTCKDTVEDRILALQDRKRQVASDVLTPHEADGRDDAEQGSGAAGSAPAAGARGRKKRGGQVRLTLDEVLRLFQ
ncbi:hypothetical protein AMAG_03894 [Allomyces macrogynus ATCC 38327]|uniref:Helicase C-terminal domain-containing protein n=1 Tax=Allomyces macrogynus (strain ATCC 38327) TaxID=578462 RepID=A0A0L0SAX2_ALLM3|nr:hypothetical protein AMAG_03894 [Allomyces macrogynus ATCC 38327]|eukprot:KNE59641.1 hypothetical protein AMAG_03894 [Allomyces macrogynus ATCC 38327]